MSRRRFARRFGWFVAPYLVLSACAFVLLAGTGEFISVDLVARMHAAGLRFVYQSRLSDHNYRLKRSGVAFRNPDVVALGPSRMLQWRAPMFRPLSFYNAGLAANTQQDFHRFVGELRQSPRILLFSVEFYSFHAGWDPIFRGRSYDDRGGWGSAEQATILRALWPLVRANPRLLVSWPPEPVYGVRTFGLRAADTGDGIRRDGSWHYGAFLSGRPNSGADSIEETLARVRLGVRPFPSAAALDRGRMTEFAEFVHAARQRGIRLIGITPPFAPAAVDALDRSSIHGNWREFQSAPTADWIRSLGVTYFNFTRLESFGGRGDEFIDPFHPSETASVRMLLAMLQDPVVQSWLPGIDRADLRAHLGSASRYEAYGSEP